MKSIKPELFQCIVDNMPEGLWIADTQHRIIYLNDAMLTIAGVSREQALGTHVLEELPEETLKFFRDEYLAALRTLQPHPYACPVETPAGRASWQNGWLIPLFEQGRLTAIACTVQDATTQKQQETHLIAREQQLELAMSASGQGYWDWDVRSGETRFSDRWCSMLGYRSDEIEAHVSSWERLVHPDDRADVLILLHAHLNGETPEYESEYRLRHKDGHWVWVLDRGRVTARDSQGNPLRMTGAHLDISKRKQLKVEGAAMLLRLASLLGDMGEKSAAELPVPVEPNAARLNPAELTKRQREVLGLVALGLSSLEIAQRLHISSTTVTTHRRDLMHKLDLHSTAELTRYAIEHKLITD